MVEIDRTRCASWAASLALAFGAACQASATEIKTAWSDPPALTIGPSGAVSLDAFTDWVDVPGLGRVDGASFYDLRRGRTERATPGRRSLMPPVLQLDKGHVFDLYLHNLLTTTEAGDLGKPSPPREPDPTNVHTHGLIVPPTGTGFSGSILPKLGDCVLPEAASHAPSTAPSGHAGVHTSSTVGLSKDPCAPETPAGMTIVDHLVYGYPIAADHPSGLFWIHPHPHGQSEIQLSNGLSGMLAIGSVWDSLFFKCRLTASPNDASGACKTQSELQEERSLEDLARGTTGKPGLLRVRYLGLKDIQVAEKAKAAGSHPAYDLIPFPRRPDVADQAFSDANDARKSRCGDPQRPEGDNDVVLPGLTMSPRGVCWSQDSSSRKVGWAFPVSGQVFPSIEVAPSTTELWRLANMSADVSYRLQLKGADGTLYRMRPVAIDGVAISAPPAGRTVGSPAGSKGASTSGAAISEIVLMPSARIEVVIERCGGPSGAGSETGCVPADRNIKAVLHTRGMATGTGDNGDLWPAIDLAEVVFKGGYKGEAGALPPRETLLPKVQVASASAQTPVSPPSTLMSTSGAEVAATSRSSSASIDGSCAANYNHGTAQFPLSGTQVRLIRLKNDTFGSDEAFGIHDELFGLERFSDGTLVTLASLIDEGAAAAAGPSSIRKVKLPDPCTDITTIEGFKAYYLPFDPARDNVTVQYGTEEYWLVVNDSPECHNFHVHQMKFRVVDADFQGTEAALNGGAPPPSDQCAGDRTAIRPINQAALLDNYPLPPSARVLFRLRFDGPKLGRFVFHCHILEHEDKGMMALLKVIE